MIKNILLTGGTGFIGSQLIKQLLEKNYHIILLKRSSSNTWRIKDLLNKIKCYDVDKCLLSEVFENDIDAVIHLATFYKKEHSNKDIKLMIDTNIEFPTQILEFCKNKKIKYFINTGSFFEYDLSVTTPLNETAPIKPHNLYAATKISFSIILKQYTESSNIKAIDLKIFSPYGPKDNEKLYSYLIKNFIQKKIVEMTKGEQKWNWTYVKDICGAYLKSINYVSSMNKNYEVFNIGSNQVYSIREIIIKIEKYLGVNNLVNTSKEYSSKEIFYVNCDNTKAKKLLGWNVEHTIDEGIKKTIEFYQKEDIKNE